MGESPQFLNFKTCESWAQNGGNGWPRKSWESTRQPAINAHWTHWVGAIHLRMQTLHVHLCRSVIQYNYFSGPLSLIKDTHSGTWCIDACLGSSVRLGRAAPLGSPGISTTYKHAFAILHPWSWPHKYSSVFCLKFDKFFIQSNPKNSNLKQTTGTSLSNISSQISFQFLESILEMKWTIIQYK